jgi:hypothetical protein
MAAEEYHQKALSGVGQASVVGIWAASLFYGPDEDYTMKSN